MQTLSRKEASPLSTAAYAVLAVLAVLARVFWWRAGIRFDIGPVLGYWQFLDPTQLASRPFEALLNLHAQPPALNALAAAGLGLLGWRAESLFALLFAASGVVANVASFHVARSWSGRTSLAAAVFALSLASPDAILYENLFFTTQPVLCALALSAAALERYLGSRRLRWYAVYGALLLLTLSTRSMYGTAWMAVGLAIPFAATRPHRREVATAAALLGASLLWPLKNGLLFGSWGSSSWMGMNFYNTVYLQSFSTGELEASVAGPPLRRVRPPGSTSLVGDIKPFSPPESYVPFLRLRPTGIPVLDAPHKPNGFPNYNWIGYVEVSSEYLRDYARVVSENPGILVRVFRSSLGYFVRPAFESPSFPLLPTSASNLTAARPVLDVVRRTIVLAWPGGTPISFRPFSLLALALLLLCLAGLPVLAATSLHAGDPLAPLALFVLWNVAYVTLVGNLFESLENMRFRLEIEPLMLIAAAALASAAFESRHRTSKKRGPPV